MYLEEGDGLFESPLADGLAEYVVHVLHAHARELSAVQIRLQCDAFDSNYE